MTRIAARRASWSGAAGVAETAAAIVAVERIDQGPLHFFDALHHQLGNSVAALNVERCAWVGVQQHDFDLTAIGSVDETRCVGDGEAMFERVSAAG